MIDARDEMQLRRLMQQRDSLLKEVEALRNKIAGLDMAIELIGEAHADGGLSFPRKIHVSETIVELLREAGEIGIKAKAAIELAADRGIRLNRGSVYSLLNRMTRSGTVVHEDDHYKLTEFSHARERAGAFLTANRLTPRASTRPAVSLPPPTRRTGPGRLIDDPVRDGKRHTGPALHRGANHRSPGTGAVPPDGSWVSAVS